jgi:predicted DNA-binding transcriptional regulator AlpA
MEKDAFSVDEFCKRHSISRSQFYVSLKDGTGPRTMKVGTRTLISKEAAADWRRKRELASARQDEQAA